MKNSLRLNKVPRIGTLPGGCSRIANSGDVRTLVYAAVKGNRATRREARRKLKKLIGVEVPL